MTELKENCIFPPLPLYFIIRNIIEKGLLEGLWGNSRKKQTYFFPQSLYIFPNKNKLEDFQALQA